MEKGKEKETENNIREYQNKSTFTLIQIQEQECQKIRSQVQVPGFFSDGMKEGYCPLLPAYLTGREEEEILRYPEMYVEDLFLSFLLSC